MGDDYRENLYVKQSIIQDIIPIIEHHHENWDGTGYPNSASGQDRKSVV